MEDKFGDETDLELVKVGYTEAENALSNVACTVFVRANATKMCRVGVQDD